MPGVQPAAVVVGPDDLELAGERRGVADLLQVRPLVLDVAEQGLDPGLVGRGAGPAEVGHDRAHRQELAGGAGAHLGAVVGHGQQDRDVGVVAIERGAGLSGFDAGPQAFVVEGTGEQHLDLGD
jgi:hypothetical protein